MIHTLIPHSHGHQSTSQTLYEAAEADQWTFIVGLLRVVMTEDLGEHHLEEYQAADVSFHLYALQAEAPTLAARPIVGNTPVSLPVDAPTHSFVLRPDGNRGSPLTV